MGVLVVRYYISIANNICTDSATHPSFNSSLPGLSYFTSVLYSIEEDISSCADGLPFEVSTLVALLPHPMAYGQTLKADC